MGQAFARGRKDPHTSHPSGIEIPRDVHFHAIGAAGPFFAGKISEEAAILDRTIRLDVVSEDLPLIRAWSSVIDI